MKPLASAIVMLTLLVPACRGPETGSENAVPNVTSPEVTVTRESALNPTPVTAVAKPVCGIKLRAMGTVVGAGVGDEFHFWVTFHSLSP